MTLITIRPNANKQTENLHNSEQIEFSKVIEAIQTGELTHKFSKVTAQVIQAAQAGHVALDAYKNLHFDLRAASLEIRNARTAEQVENLKNSHLPEVNWNQWTDFQLNQTTKKVNPVKKWSGFMNFDLDLDKRKNISQDDVFNEISAWNSGLDLGLQGLKFDDPAVRKQYLFECIEVMFRTENFVRIVVRLDLDKQPKMHLDTFFEQVHLTWYEAFQEQFTHEIKYDVAQKSGSSCSLIYHDPNCYVRNESAFNGINGFYVSQEHLIALSPSQIQIKNSEFSATRECLKNPTDTCNAFLALTQKWLQEGRTLQLDFVPWRKLALSIKRSMPDEVEAFSIFDNLSKLDSEKYSDGKTSTMEVWQSVSRQHLRKPVQDNLSYVFRLLLNAGFELRDLKLSDFILDRIHDRMVNDFKLELRCNSSFDSPVPGIYGEVVYQENGRWFPFDARYQSKVYSDLRREIKLTKADFVDYMNNSDYVPEWNPFTEFYNRLPEVEGEDEIQKLWSCLHLKEANPAEIQYMYKRFKKWLAGCLYQMNPQTETNYNNPNMMNFDGHRTCMVLAGGQSAFKSTFFKNLSPMAHFYKKDLVVIDGQWNPENKQHKMMMARNMLLVLDELYNMMKTPSQQLAMKSILSDTAFSADPKFQGTQEFFRKCTFCATSNTTDFLYDKTGNTRWFIVEVDLVDGAKIGTIDTLKLWGQVKALVDRGELIHYYSPDEAKIVELKNKSFESQSAFEEHFTRVFVVDENAGTLYTTTEIIEAINRELGTNWDLKNSIALGKQLPQEVKHNTRRNTPSGGKSPYKKLKLRREEIIPDVKESDHTWGNLFPN